MQRADEHGGAQENRSQKCMLHRGCLFCKTGKEKEVVQQMGLYAPALRAIAPVKLRYRRVGGVALEEKVSLIPGYVFFESSEGELPARLTRLENVLRLLTYPDGDWKLTGYDDQFAKMLFKADGVIGFSKAIFDEGNRIHILDGFMKDYEGSIIRVNRRARTAEVSVDFQGKKISMWLGYELLQKM